MGKTNKKSRRGRIVIGEWWYLMINIPLLVFVKSGITGVTVKSRAKGLDRAVPGIPIPIFAVWLPGDLAYRLEQGSHQFFKPIKAVYYRGDGHSEWFWFPAAPFIILEMAFIWSCYLSVFCQIVFGDWLCWLPVAKNILKIICKIFATFI